MLSVLTWYSLAYLVIAMGLFGLTVGSLRVYFTPERYTEERLGESLARAGLLFALAIPASYCLLLIIPLRAEPVATTVVLFVVFSAALALPFIPVGMVVAAALTRTRFPVGRVYAVDLLGAALGAPLVPLLLRGLDGGSAILLLGTVAALGAVGFAYAANHRGLLRKGLLIAAGLAALALVNSTGRFGLVPLWAKGAPEHPALVEQELWNSHSRIQVFPETRTIAAMWGPGVLCKIPPIRQRGLVIDAHAATPLYHAETLEDLRFLDCDVTNVVHALRPEGPVAIIGVGGSRDLQAALLTGHDSVTGIELNGRLLEILRGPLGKPTLVPDDPRVKLVHDEARSWIARSDEKFQIIQASLIDTWAATGAGAHALSENGLYTVEAWDLFLNHLEPGGIFTVSRWSTVETARLLSLAMGSLFRRGVENPREHIALIMSSGFPSVTTLLLGKDPFTKEDLQRLRSRTNKKGFTIVASPTKEPRDDRMKQILKVTSWNELQAITLGSVLDFRPPTDNQPFFFNVVRFAGFWKQLPQETFGTIEGNLIATRTLALSLGVSIFLVAVAIIWPLWRRAKPAHHIDKKLWAAIAYFSLIGVGFMLAEIGLLQRLSLILGHPIYSLIVVLSSLVAAAGIGSLISDRLPLDRAPACFIYPAVIVAVLLVLALGWDEFASGMMAAATTTRVVFSVVVMAITGLFLGVAFPAGMRLVQESHPDETPWFWGMNGIGSVVASSLAVVIAVSFGLTAVLIVAAACYVLLIPIILLMK